ncbi:MAG: histidine--tRNA ligase [Clostridia bacterium]
MVTRPKGTKDVVPAESYKWQKIEEVEKNVLRLYGFKEMRTPIFEHTELFLRSVGDTTDIVNKEMYTFLDKGERSLTLKPEGTSGIVRAFIENGLDNEPQPIKTFTFTPCFRYERPQAGRLREHHQCSIEAFGSESAKMDAEIIGMVKTIFDKLKFINYKININSIGCKECRKKYNEKLKAYYADKIDFMCDDCKSRLEKNPLRLLDCKDEKCQGFKKDAPKIINNLCDDCAEHFNELKKYLAISDIHFEINPLIVRGLDYYNRTVFEFITNEDGALGTICGGGRYDGLVETLGGKNIPAVGVGLGFERLISLMEKNEVKIKDSSNLDLYIATVDENMRDEVFALALNLRDKGVSVDYDLIGRSFKSEMKYANKISARYIIVFGETEYKTKTFKVKNMATSFEKEVAQDELASFILKNK